MKYDMHYYVYYNYIYSERWYKDRLFSQTNMEGLITFTLDTQRTRS